jgi:DNA-binding beta-propeller fold protein YncE
MAGCLLTACGGGTSPTGTASPAPSRLPTATATPTAPPTPSPTPQATLAGCPAPVALGRLAVLHQFSTDADDVAVDSAGNIWVSSPNAGRIDELAADGTSIASFADPNEPEGLVPMPDGDVVVAEQALNRLDVLVPSTGVLTPLLTVPNSTGNVGVDDIALSSDGADILVPDSPSGRLLEIPVGGGAPTVLASGLGRPVDAGQLPDGAIVVAAESNPGLVEVAGGATQAVGSLTDLDEAIPDQGLVYVTDLGTDEVLAVDPASGASRVLVTGLPSPQGLVALPDGSLLLVDSTREVIVTLPPCA